MKKLLFLLSITLIGQIKGQITFPAPGATWHFAHTVGAINPPTYNEKVRYSGDTFVYGKSAHILANTHYMYQCGSGQGNTYVYTSNDSVFFYNGQTLGQWQLLYSFNTPVGQSWTTILQDNQGIDTITVKVDSIKYTTINSFLLKSLYVNYSEIYHMGSSSQVYTHSSIIMDRLGDTYYLLNYISDRYPLCDFDLGYKLLCYEDSTISLYQADTLPCSYTTVGIKQFSNLTETKIYPNPTSDQFFIEINATDKLTVNLYDVNGRHVFSKSVSDKSNISVATLDNGIYSLTIKTVDSVINKKLVIVH